MWLKSKAFLEGGSIPARYAFGRAASDSFPGTRTVSGDNINPDLSWSAPPAATGSLALLCVDPDAPADGDGVDQEGVVIAPERRRTDFYHWVMIDMAPEAGAIAEGAVCRGVTIGGKAFGPTPHGLVGVNDYSVWFADDPEMKGVYGGYDGPCPPWNDSIPHRYVFTLYALDVPTLGMSGPFAGAEVRQAMQGRVLATASWTGTYRI